MRKAHRTEERFWATTYAEEYIQRNREFDHQLGASAWRHGWRIGLLPFTTDQLDTNGCLLNDGLLPR